MKMLNRIFEMFTNLLAVWTVSAVLLGYFYPSVLTFFRPYLDYMFMFTMLGIGFVLNPEDFLPLVKRPYLPLLGTLTQFAIMPVSAFLIARALNLPPGLALGLIVAGSVPGAMASNVLSYLAKADVAYSISVTTVSTFLAPVLTPFFTYFLAKSYIQVDFFAMFKSIIFMVVLPLGVGLTLKHFFRKKIESVLSFFPALSTLFIAFICGLIVALNKERLADSTLVVFAAIFLLNIIGLVGGYNAGRLYRFDMRRKKTLALEVGMQNAGLGAVLALKHFSAEAALPSALFATWCVITASLLAWIWNQKSK